MNIKDKINRARELNELQKDCRTDLTIDVFGFQEFAVNNILSLCDALEKCLKRLEQISQSVELHRFNNDIEFDFTSDALLAQKLLSELGASEPQGGE